MTDSETPYETQKEAPQDENGAIRQVGAITLVLLPWITMALMSLAMPKDYFAPLFAHPIGQIFLGVCGVVSLIAFFLTFKSKSVAIWILTGAFLVLPQMIVPFLGPAIITIINALGPTIAH